MVELARWLFERHHIPYDEEGHAPLIHVPYTLRRKGGVEVPAVVTAASVWKGARETLYGLDTAGCAPAKSCLETLRRRARRTSHSSSKLLDRLLLNVRRFAYFHMLQVKPVVVPVDVISGPFVLGLDRGVQFADERRKMYESVARIDTDDLRARINREANLILDRAVNTNGEIDVAHGYAHPIAARTAVQLFGIRGPTEADLMRVCRALFHFSFLANPDEQAVTLRAGRAAAEMRTWMTDEIARRRTDGIEVNDVLGRLLAIRDVDGAMLDGETVRRILVGLLVGAIDTTGPTNTATGIITKGGKAQRDDSGGLRCRHLSYPGPNDDHLYGRFHPHNESRTAEGQQCVPLGLRGGCRSRPLAYRSDPHYRQIRGSGGRRVYRC
jgi:hypothetical protein